ncbi:MAG: carboxypeptidase-like regulatory domain-containing protein, partial [Ignavibacteriaceae bacterium]|nr:carboxypeptidase-like regulatory domain-containing protein [Ignavibacteriaceae bacterium]
MKKNLLFCFSVLICSFSFTFAGTTGKITGTVTYKTTGEPLPFVNIIIVGTNLGAATDIDGNYVILN